MQSGFGDYRPNITESGSNWGRALICILRKSPHPRKEAKRLLFVSIENLQIKTIVTLNLHLISTKLRMDRCHLVIRYNSDPFFNALLITTAPQ